MSTTDTTTAFEALLQRLRDLSPSDRERLCRVGWDAYGRDRTRWGTAARALFGALENAGRMTWYEGPAWDGIAEAEDIAAFGEDLAAAVLGRDLIPDADYQLLTGWASGLLGEGDGAS